MSPEEDLSKDLPLDEEKAEGVTGGAAEVGEGSAELREAKERLRRAASPETTLAPDHYQVIRNDKP